MKHTKYWSEILPGMIVFHNLNGWSIKFISKTQAKKLAKQNAYTKYYLLGG